MKKRKQSADKNLRIIFLQTLKTRKTKYILEKIVRKQVFFLKKRRQKMQKKLVI